MLVRRHLFAFIQAMIHAIATITALLLAAQGETLPPSIRFDPAVRRRPSKTVQPQATAWSSCLRGLQHAFGKHRSILYVDKSVKMELREGHNAEAGQTVGHQLEAKGEITTDQDTAKSSTISRLAGSSISHAPRWKDPGIPRGHGVHHHHR